MSSESVTSVEAPPAASEQTRAAPESADNVSSAQLRAILLKGEVERTAQASAPAETVTPVAPPATEESTNQPAEETVTTESETANPPATDAQPELTEPGETPDEVLSQLSSLDPKSKQIAEKAIADFKAKQQASIDKRIAKERAKRGEVERQLEDRNRQLREQIQSHQQQPNPQSPAAPPVPIPGVPLSHIHSPQELVKLQQEAKDTIRFVERTLDRDDIDQGIQIGNQVFTKKDLKERMWQAKEVLEDQIPQRAAFLQQRDNAVQSAFEKFPFLKDQSSPEFARAQAIIRDAPAIRNAPNYLEIVGKLILGEKALEANGTAKPAPAKLAATRPKPASDQTVSGAAGGSVSRVAPESRAAATLAAEREKIVANGNVNSAALRQYLKKSDQLRNSR